MNLSINLILGSLISCICVYICGCILLNYNHSHFKISQIAKIIIFIAAITVLNSFNTEILRGIVKILSVYFIYCIFYKTIFHKEWNKTINLSLIIYLCFWVSEVIVAIPLSMASQIFKFNLLELKNGIIVNFLIAITVLLIVNVCKKRLMNLANNANLLNKSKLLIIFLVLITIALIAFKMPLSEWQFNLEFVLTMIMLLSFCLVGIFMIKQNSDIEKASSMYQQVVKYSNTTNKLLEDYRMVSHEHKNQLSIIRQMVNKNNNELIDYINSLIEKYNDIKYKWAADLNNIPDEGLKGLLNYKLLEAEEAKIKLTVIISKDISKIKLKKLNAKERDELYSIIGIYLDNAIQASIESKEKDLSLEVYKDKKNMVFVFANTYKGNVNIEKVDSYGYTTKGKNHGIGLHIVKRILNDNELFSQSRKILNNYYIQDLIIHTNNIANEKKKK